MLGWTWYALSGNPEAEATLHEELHGVLGGRAPGAEDFPRLPYLRAVMNEVLRMYPPAYILARETMETCDIGGYEMHVGSTVVISQWIMHRDARFYDDPEVFRPERWPRRVAEIACRPARYFPFSAGPRRCCIGEGFALLEAAIVIATLAQKFKFRLVPGTEVIPEPLITLRPRQCHPNDDPRANVAPLAWIVAHNVVLGPEHWRTPVVLRIATASPHRYCTNSPRSRQTPTDRRPDENVPAPDPSSRMVAVNKASAGLGSG